MKIIDRINEVATLENALAWQATEDKFLLCDCLLNLPRKLTNSPNKVEDAVWFLELEFGILLDA